MKHFLRFLLVIFVFCCVAPSAYAWDVDCTRADAIFAQCHYSTRLARLENCDPCCAQALSAGFLTSSEERTACYEMCQNNSTDGCDDGSGSGGGDSGDTCMHGSCTSHANCWSAQGTSYPICDASTHCCRAATDEEIIDARDPYCTDGGCVCNFHTNLDTTNNAEAIFTGDQHCGTLRNYTRDIGFPQTDCQTLTGSSYYVIEYSTDSNYPICDGYIVQSTSTSRSCATCKSGYQRLSFSQVNTMTYQSDYTTSDFYSWPCATGGTLDTTIYVCVQCLPYYGSWSSYGTGYQRRQVSYHANCGISSSYEYRCAAGYYGSPTSGSSGCTKCPLVCNVQSTSAVGTTNVSGCCVSSGTSSDTTGSFTITSTVCAS